MVEKRMRERGRVQEREEGKGMTDLGMECAHKRQR